MGGGKHGKNRQHNHNQRLRNRSNKLASSKHQQASQAAAKTQFSENLSFCGCGFLGIYHVGVASCFHEYAPQLSMHKIAGSSAGSLVATAHICGNYQLLHALTDILSVAIDARKRCLGPLHPSFDINAMIREALERGLPEDVHLKVSGKLHISLTRSRDLENVIVNQFESKEEVIQALLCSCFIPVWSGYTIPEFRGVGYLDGGISNNLLVLDEKTVTVSPFAGEADICPQDHVNNLLSISISNTSFSMTPHNLYRFAHALNPPSPEVLSEIWEQGFADGIRFLQRMKLISCTKCLDAIAGFIDVTNNQDDEQQMQKHDDESHQDVLLTSHTSSQRRNSTSSYDDQLIQQQHQNFIEPKPTGSLYEEGDIIIDYDCDGCVLRRNNALRDPLPKQFTDKIREACEKVNKSLYCWFYSHRPIKYLTYMVAPYYLPMDLSLALLLKYWQQLPNLGVEMMRYAHEFKTFLVEIIKKINGKSLTNLLTSPTSGFGEAETDTNDDKSSAESSISVKFTADCRRSTLRTLTTYECCLTICMFGRDVAAITNSFS